MDRESRKIYEAAVAWKEGFAKASKRVIGFNQPEYAPGERLFFRMPYCAYHPSLDDLPPTHASVLSFLKDRQDARGAVFATDLRVFISGNFGRIIRSWPYRETASARVIDGWRGVGFTEPGREGGDCFLYTYPPYWSAPTQASIARKLMLVEASHVLANGGDYDAWLADLQARLY